MAITMKGRIFRGLKIIAQIFTVQREHEHEIEIGYPTDVRHVSHVGFGNFGAGGSCPIWMNEFRGVEEVAGLPSITSAVQSRQTSWASIDLEQPVGVAPPPAEASTAAVAIAVAGSTRGAPKRPAARVKKARASSPGSSARSSSWHSTASFATVCSDSGELRPAAAGLRAA